RNTDNPHIHLLIHRDYTNRETRRTRRLKTLPREMRVSWQKSPEGTRITHPGGLSRTFEMFLEKQIERTKRTDIPRSELTLFPDSIRFEDRRLLGRAMIVEDKIERLAKMRDDNINFGDRYRYDFTNGLNRSRGFSEHDVHQRAWSKANQVVARAQAALT